MIYLVYTLWSHDILLLRSWNDLPDIIIHDRLIFLDHRILPFFLFCSLFIVYALFLWEASCYESFLVSHDVSIYCMLDLVYPYGRHYGLPLRSWYRILDIILLELVLSFPFFLAISSYLEGSASMCRSTVSHNWSVSKASFFLWKYHPTILHLGLFLVPKVVFISMADLPFYLYSSDTLSFSMVSLTQESSGSSSCMLIGVKLELLSLVLRNKSFFSCRRLYVIFPTSQMH